MLAGLPEPPHTATAGGELPIGGIFAGHRIDAVAGRGGMGIVYRATQLALDRTVALKVIAPSLVGDRVVRERFVREARSAASLEHPNVIPIHYAGEEDGVGYIAMRYVEGDDLRSLVRREGGLEPARAARLVAQVGDALDAAHAAGLVHRDVKPANVLLGPGEHVYLTDFGLTKILEEASAATQTAGWVGTLDYVAPEQIRGERVDARTDVYALGCLLFFLLSGRVPFTGEGHERKLWSHLTEPPPRTGHAGLDRVIARAMAKRPADRQPSAGDVGRAAVAAATGERPAYEERSVATGDAAALDELDATVPTPQNGPRHRRALVIAAAAVVAIAVAVAGLLAFSRDPTGGTSSRRTGATAADPPPAIKSIRLPHQANALEAGGGRLWLASFAMPELRAIDTRRVALTQDSAPVGDGVVAIAASGDALWAARASTVTAVDARTGRQLVPPVAVANAPVAIDADAGGAWVGLSQRSPYVSRVVRVGRASGRLERTFYTAGGVQAVRAYAGSLWVATETSHRLLRIDAGTGRIERTYRLAAGGVGDIEAGGGAVWVTLAGQGRLARIEARTGRLRMVGVGRLPWGVTYRHGVVYVANRGSSTISRIDARTLRPAKPPVRVPKDPFAVAAVGADLWVSCLGTRQVVRLSGL
jgi:Protein kinase domain